MEWTIPALRSSVTTPAFVVAMLSPVSRFVGPQPAPQLYTAAAQTVPNMQVATMPHEPFDVRSAQGHQVDETLVKRWAELFSYVIAEFRAADRDLTAAIEGDYSTRRIRIQHASDKDRWVDRTLTEKELRTADLRALAKQLYAVSTRG
jgi:hypothetical protein